MSNLSIRNGTIGAERTAFTVAEDAYIVAAGCSTGFAVTTDPAETYASITSPSSDASERTTLIHNSSGFGWICPVKIPVFSTEVYYCLSSGKGIITLLFEPRSSQLG